MNIALHPILFQTIIGLRPKAFALGVRLRGGDINGEAIMTIQESKQIVWRAPFVAIFRPLNVSRCFRRQVRPARGFVA